MPATGAVLDWGATTGPDSCLLRATSADALDVHACDFGAAGLDATQGAIQVDSVDQASRPTSVRLNRLIFALSLNLALLD